MHELLKAIKDKYRIFLFTRVEGTEGSEMHKKAKESVQRLIEDGIVMEHRAMYCSSVTG